MTEPLRFTALIIISTLTFMHAIIPLVQTVIPLWRIENNISKDLALRVIFRFGIFALALIQVMFSARALNFINWEQEILRNVTFAIWVLVAISVVVSWMVHPTGPRGL